MHHVEEKINVTLSATLLHGLDFSHGVSGTQVGVYLVSQP